MTRALALLQAGLPVDRGTAGCTFRHKPLAEGKRLGLRPETEAAIRAAGEAGDSGGVAAGVLVVSDVVPSGPADTAGLVPGDVLVSVGGELVTTFVPLEAALDSAVGQRVELQVRPSPTQLFFLLFFTRFHSNSLSAVDRSLTMVNCPSSCTPLIDSTADICWGL